MVTWSRRSRFGLILGASLAAVLPLLPALAQARDDAQASVSSGRLSLGEAVEQALATHPAVRAARASRDEARAAVGEARAAWFPTLRLASSVVRYEEPMVVTPIHGFTLGAFPAFDRTLIQTGLALNYTLLDAGGRIGRVRGARSRAAAARGDCEAAEQAHLARVVTAYVGALSAKEILAAHDHRLAALAAERSRVLLLREAGRAAQVEVLRVEAVMASADAQRLNLASALEVAEHDLARLTGLPPARTRAANLDPVAPAVSSPVDRETEEAKALGASPAVAAARDEARAAAAALTAARSARWPLVGLSGNWVDRGGASVDHAAEWSAGVELAWPLFTGGATSHAVARAEAVRRAAQEREALAGLQLRQELDRALASLTEARAAVTSLATAAARFAEVARIEQLSLEAGSGTQADYLRAEADLLEARAREVEARHREIAARVELARVTGELSPAWIARNLQPVGDMR